MKIGTKKSSRTAAPRKQERLERRAVSGLIIARRGDGHDGTCYARSALVPPSGLHCVCPWLFNRYRDYVRDCCYRSGENGEQGGQFHDGSYDDPAGWLRRSEELGNRAKSLYQMNHGAS
jgi:hypothetical protein